MIYVRRIRTGVKPPPPMSPPQPTSSSADSDSESETWADARSDVMEPKEPPVEYPLGRPPDRFSDEELRVGFACEYLRCGDAHTRITGHDLKGREPEAVG